jgi:hypothetical protein
MIFLAFDEVIFVVVTFSQVVVSNVTEQNSEPTKCNARRGCKNFCNNQVYFL